MKKAGEKMKSENKKQLYAVLLAIINIILLYSIINFDYYEVPIILKVLAGLLVLVVSGYKLGELLNQNVWHGIVMFRSKKMIEEIDYIARRFEKIIVVLCDITLIWGLGLLGSYILYKHSKKSIRRTLMISLVGLFLLVFTLFYIAPIVSVLSMSVISGIDYSTAIAESQEQMFDMMLDISKILVVVGGYMMFFVFLLVYSSVMIIYNLILTVMTGVQAPEPSAVMIIPGVSIPFFEGIIAMIILLAFHELSHGFLARVAKVKLESVGVVLIGILPIGAFVEPNEKELEKRSVIEKVRTFMAGSGVNFIILFISFLVFLIAEPYLSSQIDYNVVYYGNITEFKDAVVISVNDIPAKELNFSEIPYKKGDEVRVLTDRGEFITFADEKNMIGIVQKTYFENSVAEFVFNLIALCMVLNFFVAIFNLLPAFIFDGYKILESVFDKKYLKYINYLIILSILIQFLPWLWK
ncbi:site-2 protease family protein [Candidatus Micrarchaeota archaeon]|jgi:membrane-associated protease RseP (regulator of RpoE activity)|nr:site-2 protease family protein [Candidatus Micrarchaeota archaeon]